MRRATIIRLVLVLGPVWLLTVPAGAATPERPPLPPPAHDPVAKAREAVGNTILETFSDGRATAVWLAADGTYAAQGRRENMSNGRWLVRGDRLCFKQAHPFVFGLTFCTLIPETGMGQAWPAKSPTGEDIVVKVEPGHVTPP